MRERFRYEGVRLYFILRHSSQSMGKECVFIEIVRGLKRKRHFYVECIPLPKEAATDAPIYFQKAISEVCSF